MPGVSMHQIQDGITNLSGEVIFRQNNAVGHLALQGLAEKFYVLHALHFYRRRSVFRRPAHRGHPRRLLHRLVWPLRSPRLSVQTLSKSINPFSTSTEIKHTCTLSPTSIPFMPRTTLPSAGNLSRRT